MIAYGIGFLISLGFAVGFIWIMAHLFCVDDRSIICGLVVMYCLAGGRDLKLRRDHDL